MGTKFGQKYRIEGQNKNYTTVFIETDSNDANYISTKNDYRFIDDDMDAYLWLLKNVIDLENVKESISKFLVEQGFEDKLVREYDVTWLGKNLRTVKEYYSCILAEWLSEILDMPFDEFNHNSHYGHTLNRLEVRQYEEGYIYDIDYSDAFLRNGKAVAQHLVKMVEAWITHEVN